MVLKFVNWNMLNNSSFTMVKAFSRNVISYKKYVLKVALISLENWSLESCEVWKTSRAKTSLKFPTGFIFRRRRSKRLIMRTTRPSCRQAASGNVGDGSRHWPTDARTTTSATQTGTATAETMTLKMRRSKDRRLSRFDARMICLGLILHQT